ncbi:hypothetical protein I7I48_02784 [Histoplasma ohiense]|nr:hypothetical protein I7I48_02784 [Histoplasma ohiense (nom. inval.)]
MRASFICIILYSISLTGPACVGGIQIFARQNVDALEPTKITPTVTLSPIDAATNSSPGTQSTSKPDPTATSKSGNDTTSTESPRPTDLSFLNGTEPDPNLLPLRPRITPGLSVAGVVLIISGGIYALVGIRKIWIQIFFSVGFSSALAVTILIIYLMNPPISDAVQGAFVVAATATGAVFGGISLAFQEVSEGFGCLLGGFSLSMWILPMKPGGLLVETGHKAAFIASLTIGFYCLSFIRRTRIYALICATSFSGATAVILGIDCFSKAGLKEFWVYIWGLNENVFPSIKSTYPITRGIRAELSGIIAIFLMGLVSQAKVWKMIKDRRRRETSLVDEEQKKHDQVEEEIAKNLEMDTNRERAHWESVYGDQQRPQNDSGIEIGREEGHERFSGTSVNRTSENRIYEMDALRMPGGDARNYTPYKSRESVQLITAAAAATPAQSDTPPSNNSSSGDAQDTKPSITPGHQPGLHELPGDTEMPGSANIAINSSRANPFEIRMDDECSSVAASLAESDYMACARNGRDPAFRQPIHGRIVESNCTDDGGDGLTFVNDTRSISSSVEVEANEEHDYNMGPASQMESGTRCNPSSIYSGSQGAAESRAVTEPDSSAVGKANGNGESMKDHDTTPMVETRWAESNGSEQIPSLPYRINGCETEYAPADDNAFPGPEISSKKTPDQDGKLAELTEVAATHSPGFADAIGGSTASDQQMSGKHDRPSDVTESLSSSIPVANRLSKIQSLLLPRVQLTSESVDNIPSHTSRVVLSHRTNEWAKHISDAGPPEVMEMDDLQQDTETDEPVAPVLVSELQQTAASTLSSRELDIDHSAVPRSQHGADPRLTRSSLRKSYIGIQTARDISSSPPGRSPNSTNSSQTPPIYPLHRSGSNSTLGVAAQVETNRARPTSSISSTYKPASGILESNESHDRAPSFRGHRMSSPPLLAQRESAIRNRSLLLPSNISSATVNHFSKSQSRLSLNIPQTQHRSTSPYPTKNNTSVESTDDIPLSVRRELIHRGNNFQNQSQTQPSLHRPASVCSFPSLDNMSLVTARRQYDDHSQVQDSLQVREAKFARWRESLRNENIIKHLPDAAVETRWANLVKEHQWSQLGKQKEAIRTSYRNSAIEQAMRKGDMLSMHNEALRRMQASANKHAS